MLYELITTERGMEHALAALLLLGRLGDIGSTWLASPTLVLEANPLMRRGRWPLAFASVLVCFLPYYSTALGVMAVVPSFLVTASNLSRAWIARALGEQEYLNLLERAARAGSLSGAILVTLGSAAFVGMAAGVLFVLSDGLASWGGWFAMGMLTHALVIAVHGTSFVLRLFRRVRTSGAAAKIQIP